MAKEKVETKKAEKKPKAKKPKNKEKNSSNQRRNGFEVRVLQTKYGIKVLVRQGDNKVWLSQRHLALLFSTLLAEIFGKGEEE